MKISALNQTGNMQNFSRLQRATRVLENGIKISTVTKDGSVVSLHKMKPNGFFEGFKKFADGSVLSYFTFNNKSYASLNKKGKTTYLIDSAYKLNGKPNIPTKKEITDLFQRTKNKNH